MTRVLALSRIVTRGVLSLDVGRPVRMDFLSVSGLYARFILFCVAH